MNNEILTGLEKQFRYYMSLGERSLDRMSDDQLNHIPATDSNSAAMIVKHMHGNMLSRWTDFFTSDGEKKNRNRDQEFYPERLSSANIRELWTEGWRCFFDAFEKISPFDLDRIITIRAESLTVSDALFRQLAHYAYHVGQIVFLAKISKGEKWESLSIPLPGKK
jgi:hypothetical protein